MYMEFRELTEKEIIEFRQWANDNYKKGEPISELWHPVVVAECEKINKEN